MYLIKKKYLGTTIDDCWMIINGKVYDITAYIPHHLGGHRPLLKFGGMGGSENVEYHSSKMLYLLDTYFYIGRVECYKEESGSIEPAMV